MPDPVESHGLFSREAKVKPSKSSVGKDKPGFLPVPQPAVCSRSAQARAMRGRLERCIATLQSCDTAIRSETFISSLGALYGRPRIRAYPRYDNISVDDKRVARLMDEPRLRGSLDAGSCALRYATKPQRWRASDRQSQHSQISAGPPGDLTCAGQWAPPYRVSCLQCI